MNILSFFIIVPLLMLAGLSASRSVNQVRRDGYRSFPAAGTVCLPHH